jgi:hypothetical protein
MSRPSISSVAAKNTAKAAAAEITATGTLMARPVGPNAEATPAPAA